jgi:hypothetical protein
VEVIDLTRELKYYSQCSTENYIMARAQSWIAQGSGFESQRGHLFFGISPRGEISQEGFAQGLVSPPATSRYRGSMRISEAPLVCTNRC